MRVGHLQDLNICISGLDIVGSLVYGGFHGFGDVGFGFGILVHILVIQVGILTNGFNILGGLLITYLVKEKMKQFILLQDSLN